MRRLQGFVTLVVVAAGCNEALGLDPGRPGADEIGGSSGSAGAGGTATSGAGGSSMVGGSSSTTGGNGGGSGEAGTSEGGTGGTRGGRGGAGGSSSGAGGDSGGPGGGGAGGRETCSSLDCRAHGYDFCINGECAEITSPECDTILGDEWLERDPEAEPYILGALARRDLAWEMWSLRLAMQEFSGHGRIPIEGEERRPVLLICHGEVPDGTPSIDWLAPLRDGHDHLIELGVSSILLLLKSRSETQGLVERALNLRGDDVFFLDVGGATQGLLNASDIDGWEFGLPRRYGRLWHMLGDTRSLALPYVPLVERIEELVNPRAATGREPTRLVAVTGTPDEYDREILGALLDSYSPDQVLINDMVLEDQPGQSLVVARGSHAEIVEFEPHIVLDFGGGDTSTIVNEALRARGVPLPFYIYPAHAGSGFLLGQIAADPSLRTRVVGTYFASAEDPTLMQEYLQRLRSIVLTGEVDDLDCCENFYDAVYFLIYGAAAGGRGGTAKAAGFERLVVGPERHIGPDGIQAVLSRLASSPDATLKLSGPSGDFPFHPPTGGRIAFGNAWCIDENLEFVMDALRYDRASYELTGTPCWDP